MYLNDSDQVSYLANIIFLASADDGPSPKVAAALEEIRTSIGAKRSTYDRAQKLALSGDFSPIRVANFAVLASNLTDMLYIVALEDNLSDSKKDIIAQFSQNLSLTDEQRAAISHDAIERLKANNLSLLCPQCGTKILGDSKYCPQCGASLIHGPPEPEPVVPESGITIEFCESSSGNFPSALKLAKAARSFSTRLVDKKIWYLASWPLDEMENVVQLVEVLGGIRNKRCYREGKQVDWDELFGFVWCAGERKKAFRPTEYCFGKSDNRLNPWGCKQAKLDWTEWGQWFSYGRFEKQGVLRAKRVWIFDKQRIRHELLTNLHKYRFCPYVRFGLVESVLRQLPDQVEVTVGGPWKYSHSYQETPGCIKILEVEKSNGMEFTHEYFSDGVRPRDLKVLSGILKAAFADVGITDITPHELVG